MRGTLNFGKDGRVTGRSFCNNYGGNYTLTGEGLSIELKMSTLMACLPEVATQEKLFTELLEGAQRFEIDSNGTLVLHSGNRTLKARRG
jgi:heat shock protein HslJ